MSQMELYTGVEKMALTDVLIRSEIPDDNIRHPLTTICLGGKEIDGVRAFTLSQRIGELPILELELVVGDGIAVLDEAMVK